MGQIVSHTEVESLLSAFQQTPEMADQFVNPELVDKVHNAWAPVDFGVPQPVDDHEGEVLCAIHAKISLALQLKLSSLVNCFVDVTPINITQRVFDEAARQENSSRLVWETTLGEHSAPSLVTWDPSLAYRLIQQMLGAGSCPDAVEPNRIDAALQQRLLDRLCQLVVDEFMQLIYPIQTEPEQNIAVAYKPRDSLKSRSSLVFLCISFDISLKKQRGLLVCWIPSEQIRFANANPSQALLNLAKVKMGDRKEGNWAGVGTLPLRFELVAELARLRISTSELLSLSIGDILLTTTRSDSDTWLTLENRILHEGRVGKLAGRRAIQLTKII